MARSSSSFSDSPSAELPAREHDRPGAPAGTPARPDDPRQLREELERTRRELEIARREAHAANDAKDRFLSSVSHELRTPLSAIVLWTSLIEDQKIVDEQQLREALDSIKRSAEELRELIEELVDTSRIVSGKLRLDRRDIDLAAVVHNAVEQVRETAGAKSIQITETLAPDTGLYRGDARRLQQLVTHLVQNAVKFTPPSGRIRVALHKADAELVVEVSDTGIGIAAEHLDHVFERFMQVEHVRVRTESGVGLGLAISKQIAEMHGGTIHAESSGLGQGTTMIVRLPTAPTDVHAGVSPSGEKLHLHGLLTGRNVLLVEDAAATRRALTAVLVEAGANVEAVESAPLAREMFERHRPDLIVSDLGLPAIDGFTLLRQIRESEEAQHAMHVPAVAVTAFAGEEICEQALESGFQTCLTKPVEPLHLVATLAALAPRP
ncbi:MAG TPA: ATP-binding protein [Opitutus sp.]|nr:ATP-binding protein [Opitutus sp.]